MKTLARHILTVTVLLGFVQTATAQTADEIIEKHIAAMGGRAALAKLTSRTTIGTITLSTPGGEISGPIEVYNQAPNKARTLIELDLSAFGAGKMTIDQRFDGTTGYAIDTLQGNRDITGDQLETMRNAVFPSPFLDYKAAGMKLEMAPKEKVGDRDAYVLIATPKTGPVTRHYFDAETYAEIRQVSKLNVPPVGELEQTVDLSDFRVVDGINIPFKLNATSTAQNFTVVMTKVEHNGAIDQTTFSKPAN